MANILGIDLGTTYSAMARLDENGTPLIVENSDGENLTPSIIEFTGKNSIYKPIMCITTTNYYKNIEEFYNSLF